MNYEYTRVLLARKLKNIMGRPSTSDFKRFVLQTFLPNCPINVDDIIAAENIFSTYVGAQKKKRNKRFSK